MAGESWVSTAVTTGQGQAPGALRGKSAVLLGEPQEGAQERTSREGSPYPPQRLNLGPRLDPETYPRSRRRADELKFSLVIHRCDRVHSLGLTK